MTNAPGATIHIPLTDGWMLYRNDSPTGEPVRVPHDAMLAEPRSADAVTGSAGAYFPGGTYRYERTIDVPESWADQLVTLELEGVHQKATVLFDGEQLAEGCYPYTSLTVDLTDQLRPGSPSTLAVIADNTHQPNCRWYTGSGLFRPAWLHVRPRCHIAQGGIRVSTETLSPARIRVTTSVCDLRREEELQPQRPSGRHLAAQNATPERPEPEVHIAIYDATQPAAGHAPIAEGTGADLTLELPGAQLWSAESPHLYECRAELVLDGETIDVATTSFGLRKLAWGSFGLLVNDQPTLLRGGCIHTTFGILGAAEEPEAIWRELTILKEHGFNAIRSAHNPLSNAMLDACDRLGIYVMDEFADMWYRHKNPADYASDFESSWEHDLAAMVDKDYNHPSVILYSIGNENAEPAEPRGVEVAQTLADRVRQLDPTRPVTAGVNPTILWAASLGVDSFNADGEEGQSAANANGGMGEANASLLYNSYVTKMGDVMSLISRTPMVSQANAPYFDTLDIVGYNYASGRYLPDIKAHPDRPVFGSETMPYDIVRNWQLVEDHPQIIGDFMWTAWDYLGECSLAGWSDDPEMVNKPYPWLCADTGALDLIGEPTGEAALSDVTWGVADPLLFVRPCTLPNPVKAPWRATDSRPSWSWAGCEGVRTTVEVYTHAPVVKLLLNGRTVNTKRPRKLYAKFNLRYEPGELVAVACTATGHELGRTSLRSAEGPLELQLSHEPRWSPTDVAAEGLAFVRVSVADAAGIVEASFEDEVSVEVEGGELVAFGSAAQKSRRSYLEGTFPLRYGQGLAAVRPAGDGPCFVRAHAATLPLVELTL